MAAGTSFVPDHATGWLGDHPHHKVTETINAASAKPYEVLKTVHVADYQSLFGRVRLDLGKTDPSRTELTVGERIKGYGQSAEDPELEKMVFQFGRYLLIGCSRLGTPAANLQGMWNNSQYPPWHCDYHSYLNLEMNYWLAEPTALPECTLPLFDYLISIIPETGFQQFHTSSWPRRYCQKTQLPDSIKDFPKERLRHSHFCHLKYHVRP